MPMLREIDPDQSEDAHELCTSTSPSSPRLKKWRRGDVRADYKSWPAEL